MRGSGQKTARKTAPPRASGDRRRFEPSAPAPTEVNGDGVEVNGDGVAVNEEQAQFGRLVAFRRQRLGMSQEELAAQMGIGLDGVVRIEQGEAPSPEMSGRLAHALRGEPPSGLARWSLPAGGLSLEAARSRLRRDGVPDWLEPGGSSKPAAPGRRPRLAELGGDSAPAPIRRSSDPAELRRSPDPASRPRRTPARGRHRHRRRAAVAARRAGRALWERRRDLELGFAIGRPLSLGRLLGDAGSGRPSGGPAGEAGRGEAGREESRSCCGRAQAGGEGRGCSAPRAGGERGRKHAGVAGAHLSSSPRPAVGAAAVAGARALPPRNPTPDTPSRPRAELSQEMIGREEMREMHREEHCESDWKRT